MGRVALITRLNGFNATYKSKENKTLVPQIEFNKLQKLKIVWIVVWILFPLLSMRSFLVAGGYHRGDSHPLFMLGAHFIFIYYTPVGFFHIICHASSERHRCSTIKLPAAILLMWRLLSALPGPLHQGLLFLVSVWTGAFSLSYLFENQIWSLRSPTKD